MVDLTIFTERCTPAKFVAQVENSCCKLEHSDVSGHRCRNVKSLLDEIVPLQSLASELDRSDGSARIVWTGEGGERDASVELSSGSQFDVEVTTARINEEHLLCEAMESQPGVSLSPEAHRICGPGSEILTPPYVAYPEAWCCPIFGRALEALESKQGCNYANETLILIDCKMPIPDEYVDWGILQEMIEKVSSKWKYPVVGVAPDPSSLLRLFLPANQCWARFGL